MIVKHLTTFHRLVLLVAKLSVNFRQLSHKLLVIFFFFNSRIFQQKLVTISPRPSNLQSEQLRSLVIVSNSAQLKIQQSSRIPRATIRQKCSPSHLRPRRIQSICGQLGLKESQVQIGGNSKCATPRPFNGFAELLQRYRGLPPNVHKSVQ